MNKRHIFFKAVGKVWLKIAESVCASGALALAWKTAIMPGWLVAILIPLFLLLAGCAVADMYTVLKIKHRRIDD